MLSNELQEVEIPSRIDPEVDTHPTAIHKILRELPALWPSLLTSSLLSFLLRPPLQAGAGI